MALPSSGPISIQDIVDEFGGSGSHSLSEYYRGGTYVPDIPQNATIPTSGQIRLSHFYGTMRTWSAVLTTGSHSIGSSSYLGFADYYNFNFGSLSYRAFAGGNIIGIYQAYPTARVYLEVDVPDLPNDDSTFVSLVIDGHTYTRRAAAYVANAGIPAATQWSWISTGTFPFPNQGVQIPIQINT